MDGSNRAGMNFLGATRAKSSRIGRKGVLAISTAALATMSVLMSAQANNTADTYTNTAGGELSTPGNWSSGNVPVSNSGDAVINNSTTTNLSGFTLAATETWGSLNDLNTNSVTFTVSAPLTLNGGDSVSGNTSDLLYVESGCNLIYTGGSSQNLVLGASGNFDVAGAATINVVVSGGSNSITKTGSGILILSQGNTFTGGVTVDSGTLGITGGSSLGTAPSPAATDLTFAGNSTLQFESAIAQGNALSANRLFSIDSGVTATVDTQTLTDWMANQWNGSGTEQHRNHHRLVGLGV
jgi:autotransporter-associated beta strand protein